MKTQEKKPPQTLREAVIYFSDPETCVRFVANLRWQDGVTCPHCQNTKVSYIKTRRVWQCLVCKKQFSVKVGTIFEDSAIALEKWLPAVWMIVNAKNGISSYEMGRALGVTQKTAWFMNHRIRLAMQDGSFEKLSGTIEADETFIGGKSANMHKAKRERVIKGRGAVGKTVVMGILQRKGKVRTKVIPNTKKETVQPEIKKNVAPGANVYTDALPSYSGLDPEYKHQIIDHAVAYVNGKVHTNGIENYWSLLKRALKGTYIHVDPDHLFRYLDEESFRYNNRETDDATRFNEAVKSVVGKRLTHNGLTDRAGAQPF
ncbi:MAG: IS1595 family transposase [Chloroflexota bacterium]